MKNMEELLSRFNDIQNLPVSEEMLGAYLEGTLQGVELSATSEQISYDSNLSELLNDTADTNVEDMVDANHPWDIYDGDYGYWELGLPPVLSSSDMISEDDIEKVDDNSADGDRILAEDTLYSQSTGNSFGVNTLNSQDMSNNSKTIIYGEKGENVSDPVYIQQPDDHSCALRSQQIVLRDFGIDIPFSDLEQIALDCQVYTNEGTYTYDIGKVLQLAGVDMHQTIGNTVDDLINELAQGHRVIVSVDANELWYNNTISDKLKNWFEDAIGHQGGNHALIVAGIEINPSNPNNNKVILTDPGAGHLRIEYPMEQFKDAWGDSTCFMAATNNPAPYQYDVETGMEIPSNFAVQQYVNAFVANNGYQLAPDMINVPQDFQPAFTGHLDVVGDVDYDTFKADYDVMVANRMPSLLSVKEQIEDACRSHEEQEVHSSDNDVTSLSSNTECMGTLVSEYEEANQNLSKSDFLGDEQDAIDDDYSCRSIIADSDDNDKDDDDDDNDDDDDDDDDSDEE